MFVKQSFNLFAAGSFEGVRVVVRVMFLRELPASKARPDAAFGYLRVIVAIYKKNQLMNK